MTHFSGSSASPSASSPLKPFKAEDFEGTPALKGDRDGGHSITYGGGFHQPKAMDLATAGPQKMTTWRDFPVTMKLIASKRINLDPPSTCRFG